MERKGHRLKIVIEEKKSKLDNLKPHDCIVGNPDDLIDLKVAEWHETEIRNIQTNLNTLSGNQFSSSSGTSRSEFLSTRFYLLGLVPHFE